MNSGGTLLPIRAHFSTKLPSNLNDSGKEDISLISLIVRCLTSKGWIRPVVLLSGCDFWIVGQGFSGSRRTRPKCRFLSCPVSTRYDWHVGLICASLSSYPALVLQIVAAGSSAGIHGLILCDLVPRDLGIAAFTGMG
jgi:hypothetical protein